MKTNAASKPGDHAVVRTFCGSFSDMDHLYEELHAETRPFARPAINIIETDAAYILQLALPGYHKGNLHLETQDDVLVIKAEACPVPSYYKDIRRFYKREFAPEPFSRSFLLPEDVSAATAFFEGGILSVHLVRGNIKVMVQNDHCEKVTIHIK
jgi:HSP20 family protein